ncbi:MAG TPA: glucosamine-6-phosphate deaminase [Chloroflexota bacterium]|nr:glucosamine-6-phosphate deaminase [Chloroflexota bacterium]
MSALRILVEPDYEGVSRRAAQVIDDMVRQTPRAVLALPTGSTPVGTYTELVRLHQETGTDWKQVTVFNLDEYVGVEPDHPESYARFMRRHLFDGINLPPSQRHIPNGLATNLDAEAARYEAAIDATGGIDLAVLGVGVNGHLGFNEPADQLRANTHVAELDEETWRRNFPQLANQPKQLDAADLPFRRAFTMGIGTILKAKQLLLLANGSAKRDILRQALQGSVTTHNPASFLQLHCDVTLILDQEAAW